MAWLGNTHRAFTAVADMLVKERADDSTLHDVLAALMDHIGVPMMLAEQYRHVPAIRALFAERGVTLLDPVVAPPGDAGKPWCSGFRQSARCSITDRRHAPHGEGEQPAWFDD